MNQFFVKGKAGSPTAVSEDRVSLSHVFIVIGDVGLSACPWGAHGQAVLSALGFGVPRLSPALTAVGSAALAETRDTLVAQFGQLDAFCGNLEELIKASVVSSLLLREILLYLYLKEFML